MNQNPSGSYHVPHVAPSEQKSSGRGAAAIIAQAQRQLQTFFDELKNGTQNYRTVASLSGQVAQEYRGRCVLELLQNAHDALAMAGEDDPRRISFVLRTSPTPVLLVANSGRSFHRTDFDGICQLGQSPKDPNESVGNKGLGFRSVLEVCTSPEIWSKPSSPGEPGYIFRFDPAVLGKVAASARDLELRGLEARSPFDPMLPLVDWSPEQHQQYLTRLSAAGVVAAEEAKTYLSPYIMPLPIIESALDVEQLLADGYVTVVRLPLDGGRTGTSDDAVRSVAEQLRALDARATVFLPHLQALVINIDGERRIVERVVDSDIVTRGPRSYRAQHILVGHSDLLSGENTTQKFNVWTRVLGGADKADEAERIRAVVRHLPNRWPEVRKVVVGVATEEAATARSGVFVIFLPTEVTTGTGALVNAPFYGSLSRRQIDFDDPYNDLLLGAVVDLVLDVVTDFVDAPAEDWKARAVVDLLSSTSAVGGKTWKLVERLRDRARTRGRPLENLPFVLCDNGWRFPSIARLMPQVPVDSPIEVDAWRRLAKFEVVATALNDRYGAVKDLLTSLGGSLTPTNDEWLETIEHVAAAVRNRDLPATWDDFLTSLVTVLPPDLRSAPRVGAQDLLAEARFLPTQDGRLLSARDTTALFFQPVRGVDDAAELVGEVPGSLQPLVAFLHPDVKTQEGPQRRNTLVQKFLDERFARGFRREDLLRDVVVPALPELPAQHGTPEAGRCAELLAWALKLVGTEEPETLLPLLGRLPVPCHGAWHAMHNAAFGPGWNGRLGDLLWTLADDLPEEEGARLRSTALLPPDDPRWSVKLNDRSELLAQSGVVAGLRLRSAQELGWEGQFDMQGYGLHQLPSNPPRGVPQDDWDQWRTAVRDEARPYYGGWFRYEFSTIWLLPELHRLPELSAAAADALSDLILASLDHWPEEFGRVRLTKVGGSSWSKQITSPLSYWLSSKAWLRDRSGVQCPLAARWLIPDSLLVGQRDRFAHLDPLSVDLARRLHNSDHLRRSLTTLGLNVYPIEDARTGPGLLNALADAWEQRRVAPQRFDVFLGQVRDAWRHLDPDEGLPTKFLVRTGTRSFSTYTADQLHTAYLPDHRDRTRSIQEHGKHILEMSPADASRIADVLIEATSVRRASALQELVLIDGAAWTGDTDRAAPIGETRYAWIPPVLLTIFAHGGTRPLGASTERWREAAARLRRAVVVECETIAVQLIDEGRVVASSEPDAQWLPEEVLAVRRDAATKYESLAAAAQGILDRQDLLKDLRLVLRALSGQQEPTPEQIEGALEGAEIDAQALADIRHRWAGTTSMLVDRIRPVLVVMGIPADGLDAAAADEEHLARWLSGPVRGWPVDELVAEARRSRDDEMMGRAAWAALGDIAELPAWNEALLRLGDRYTTVHNRKVNEQVAAHFEQAKPFLRALARHVAVETNTPRLFGEIEAINQGVEVPKGWADQWWQVPFEAVVEILLDAYRRLGVDEQFLRPFRHAQSAEELGARLKSLGVPVEPDPYETASLNKSSLEAMVARVHDLHHAWVFVRCSRDLSGEPPALAEEIEPVAYLHCWSERELLDRALAIIGDADFSAACLGCTTIEAIRERLGLDPEVVAALREERLRQQREADRKKRTFDVASEPFEVGATSYQDLFERLCRLQSPRGPTASRDSFTALEDAGLGGVAAGGGGGGIRKSSHRRPSAELRELVGVVGEMHAYRFLRAEFGADVVTRDAWVSEIRLKVMPPVPGEPDRTSDSHGYDFCFHSGGKTWHVEVKATQGDEPQFDLGVSEIEAASRFAGDARRPWRILRVRDALSDSPSFEWLPNPFEPDFRKLFRFEKAGMTVIYVRKKS